MSCSKAVRLSAVSYVVLSLSQFSEVKAQSALPPVTVYAPKPKPQARRAATRPVSRPSASRQQARRAPVTPAAAPMANVTPSTGVVGSLPAPFAGGQVATGGRVGMLGNLSVFDTPFTQNNYTEKLIRDQQVRDINDVWDNNASVHRTGAPFSATNNLLIRGFPSSPRDVAFDGLYGISPQLGLGIQSIERVEILNGPAALLYGMSPSGTVAGIVNLIPKRAPDLPLNRLTTSYTSNGNVGTHLDFARRYGEHNEWGVRYNGAIRNGSLPIDRTSEYFGMSSLGLDYRGQNLRATLDAGYSRSTQRALIGAFAVDPGFQIPRAPNLTTNAANPWENQQNEHRYVASRVEYDIVPNLTIYGAGGTGRSNSYAYSSGPTIYNAAGDINFFNFNLPSLNNQVTGEVGVRAKFDTGPISHKMTLAGTHWDKYEWFNFGFGFATPDSNIYNPILSPDPNTPLGAASANRANLDSVALTDSMSVWEGRLTGIVGVRYQNLHTASYNGTGIQTATYDADATTPMGAIVFKPTKEISIYASYAEGFGFGPAPGAGAANFGQVFPPVRTSQVETGVKADFGTVGATLAWFEINQPQAFQDPITRIFSLAGQQQNRGVDFNIFGTPIKGLRVLGGITLIDGVLTRTEGGLNDGNVAPGVPRVTVKMGAEVDVPWLRGLSVNGRVIYASQQYYDLANLQYIPEYTRFDVGARYDFIVNGKPWAARFNVLNVGGLNYWSSAGEGNVILGVPRTYKVSISADF